MHNLNKRSFVWVETNPNVDEKLVVRVKTTGHIANRWVRLDLAKRGFVSDSNSEFISPSGKVFRFKK